MHVKASQRLRLLQIRTRKVLADIKAAHMNVPCTEDRSVQDVIGLLLIDLDRLASGLTPRSEEVPHYASEFMDRRLASRWTSRYRMDAIAAEAERRFTKAIATAPDRLTADYQQALARIATHSKELAFAIRPLAGDS